jgi:tryptophan-rich sensory protein
MLFDRADSDGSRRPLLLFILVTAAIGAAGSLLTQPNIPTWYAQLNHPSITPPNWVFAPVWTTLYVLMAVAAWRVWRVTGLKSVELLAWGLQLALTFAWSVIFFGLHRIGAALVEILLLDLAILYTLLLFWRRDAIAGALLLPYLAWTGFATLLTWRFWQLNG